MMCVQWRRESSEHLKQNRLYKGLEVLDKYLEYWNFLWYPRASEEQNDWEDLSTVMLSKLDLNYLAKHVASFMENIKCIKRLSESK